MFAIWMHFKGEYWIIENMCLHMRDVSFCQQVEPQTLIMEKKNMEKIIMEKIIMEKPVNLP